MRVEGLSEKESEDSWAVIFVVPYLYFTLNFLLCISFYIPIVFIELIFPVGASLSTLSSLYTTAMRAAGASQRVFQLLDRVSTMPPAGNKCPLKYASILRTEVGSFDFHFK